MPKIVLETGVHPLVLALSVSVPFPIHEKEPS